MQFKEYLGEKRQEFLPVEPLFCKSYMKYLLKYPYS